MFDVFFKIWVSDFAFWLVKLLVLCLSVLLIVYLIYTIWLQIEKSKQKYVLHVKYVFLKTIILVTILFNIFWFLVLKFNGMYVFAWKQFDLNMTNTYFLIFPILLSYIILAVLFFISLSKIKKII